MQLPSVLHPKRFSINGMLFEIVSHSELTDEQAAKAAMLFFRRHKFKKKDQGKLFRVVTAFDRETSGYL